MSQLSHVTNNPLVALEDELRRLTAWRNEQVQHAQRIIANANEIWDAEGVPLARQIAALRAQLKPAPKPRQTRQPKQLDEYDPSWTQEDIDHYIELVGKLGKK